MEVKQKFKRAFTKQYSADFKSAMLNSNPTERLNPRKDIKAVKYLRQTRLKERYCCHLETNDAEDDNDGSY